MALKHRPQKLRPSRRPSGPRSVAATNPAESGNDRWGDDQNYGPKKQTGPFTAGELGAPDQDPEPGMDNPQGAQGGLGPLGQQGQGNRQNDELEELESESDDLG